MSFYLYADMYGSNRGFLVWEFQVWLRLAAFGNAHGPARGKAAQDADSSGRRLLPMK
jgi:hypothetical protein